jgi:hypothetical protein
VRIKGGLLGARCLAVVLAAAWSMELGGTSRSIRPSVRMTETASLLEIDFGREANLNICNLCGSCWDLW